MRALTRNPNSEKAINLQRLGAEIVKGDFNDISTLEAAMKDVDAVFAMGTPFEQGVETETKNGMTIVDAVKNTRVKHLVYSSVGGADRNTGIPHFESKFKVEQYIRDKEVPFTIIGPVSFMENLTAPWSLPNIKEGRISSLLPPERKLQMISLKDIAGFVVYIIERREEFLGKRLDIASDDVSGKESAKILSRILNREIVYIELKSSQIRFMGEDYLAMYQWFNEIGYEVDISSLRHNYPEIKWHALKEWAEEQDWSIIQKPIPIKPL